MFVVSSIPGGQASGTVAVVTLTATATELGGAALSQSAGADVAATVQTVFADGAGDTDAARDAAFSDSSGFLVQGATVTVTKTETIISDPVNGGTNPKHIPGAIVRLHGDGHQRGGLGSSGDRGDADGRVARQRDVPAEHLRGRLRASRSAVLRAANANGDADGARLHGGDRDGDDRVARVWRVDGRHLPGDRELAPPYLTVSPPLLARRDLRSRAGLAADATRQICARTEMGSSPDRDSAVRTLCLNEPAAAGVSRRSRLREVLVLLLLAALALPFAASAQTPAGTAIPNTGFATYDVGATLGIVRPSNTLVITTAVLGSSSSLDFMRYAPGAPGATTYGVSPTACFNGAVFAPLPPPNAFGGGPIALGAVELVVAPSFHAGEPIFVRLTDPDKNQNPALVENVTVNLAAPSSGDAEQVQLQETGVNTGVFVGYIPSSVPPAPANNCVLAAPAGQNVTAAVHGSAELRRHLLRQRADRSREPRLRLLDRQRRQRRAGDADRRRDRSARRGHPRRRRRVELPLHRHERRHRDRRRRRRLQLRLGRLPLPDRPRGQLPLRGHPVGRLRVPVGRARRHAAGAARARPSRSGVGSRGVAFALPAGPTQALDVPLDLIANGGFISIQPSRDVVSIGDHLQFDVRLANPGSGAAPGGVTVTVVLPKGFKFTKGTVRIDDAKAGDPVVSADGRSLTFTLPPSALPEVTHIRFTTAVATGAAVGPNRTKATAAAIGGTRTNSAFAVVRVEQELLGTKSYILGRVSKGSCSNDDFAGEPLVAARVYLEDGTYAITDHNGYYHFEGVRPGPHVVQLDLESLPQWVEPLPCPGDEGHLFAGRPFSQFSDVQGGTLWRNDFRVQLKPQATGSVNQRLESQRDGDLIHYQLALNGSSVAVRNARALVMLPDGVALVPGSVRNGEAPWADPEVDGGALTFRLGQETAESWTMNLAFDARVAKSAPADLETKSVVMFDTPTQPSAKTPLAINALQGESPSAGSGMQVIDTLGLRPGEEWKAPDAPAPEPPKPTVYNKSFLDSAQPGFEWLSPESGFAPPIASVHIAIKHAPDAKVELVQNGEAVSQFNFEGLFTNEAHTVALSRWRGVDLVEGDNTFVAREIDENGNVLATIERVIHYSGPPFKVELLLDQSVLVADGRTIPVIAVRLTDQDGKPAREGAVGQFDVDPPYQPRLDESVRELRRQAGLRPESPSYQIGPDGVAKIQLEPTTASGKATMRFALAGAHQKELHPWLEAQARDWILVGLTGGTLGYADVKDHMEELSPGEPDDGFGFDRGTSFFAKGRVKGEWLMTASYDSQRDSSESDDQFRRALEGGIDPNQYYTLYGDASETRVETPSQRPLYLKLERKQFFALFGDYTTGLTTTELSRLHAQPERPAQRVRGRELRLQRLRHRHEPGVREGRDPRRRHLGPVPAVAPLDRGEQREGARRDAQPLPLRRHPVDRAPGPLHRLQHRLPERDDLLQAADPEPRRRLQPRVHRGRVRSRRRPGPEALGRRPRRGEAVRRQVRARRDGAARRHDRPHLEPVRRRPAHRPRRQHAAARRVRAHAVGAPRSELGRQGHRLAGRADPPRRRARHARVLPRAARRLRARPAVRERDGHAQARRRRALHDRRQLAARRRGLPRERPRVDRAAQDVPGPGREPHRPVRELRRLPLGAGPPVGRQRSDRPAGPRRRQLDDLPEPAQAAQRRRGRRRRQRQPRVPDPLPGGRRLRAAAAADRVRRGGARARPGAHHHLDPASACARAPGRAAR